ncbi:MAG: hypothetical protein LBC83_04965 [Oscillospiraceae bacterium]|nr:hypothetical protein [Oscillospiraceae bacterium]
MEQEYPFRPRGRHGFDRDDVISYIGQAKLQCQEHLARLEEIETAKAAWYTQAKSLESEKATLVTRVQELEAQLEQGGDGAGLFQRQELPFAVESQELAALKARCMELEQEVLNGSEALAREKELTAALQVEKAQWEDGFAAPVYIASAQGSAAETDALQAQLAQAEGEAQSLRLQIAALEQENAALQRQLLAGGEAAQTAYENERAALTARAQALEDALAGERESLGGQLSALREANTALEGEKTTLAEALAARAAEQAECAETIAALERQREALTAEKAQLEAQLPGLREQLCGLSSTVESAQADASQRITALTDEKVELEQRIVAATQETQSLQTALQAAQTAKDGEATAERERAQGLEQENFRQAQRIAALEQSENAARQAQAAAAAEAAALRAQVSDMERFSGEKNADVLRSMVLASFNYSNLYVENNLETAKVITNATSRNIGRVSETAATLLEQLETIGREFNETTDSIRRNLASFQRELDSIQNGMNIRLSADRFAPLLQENEKLRERLEAELLAELSCDDETPANSSPQPDPQQAQPLPFSEDLKQNYSAFLNE